MLLLLVATLLATAHMDCMPYGVRLIYGQYYSMQGGPTQLYVMFNTNDSCTNSYVGFGSSQVYKNITCSMAPLNFAWDANLFNTTIYTCAVTNIDFSQPILYMPYGVDANNNTTPYQNQNITTFLLDKTTKQTVRMFVFGDWQYLTNQNLTNLNLTPITNCLTSLTATNPTDYQGIIFVGDQAYDLYNVSNYLQFLNMLQPYSSLWPFMAAVGNHQTGVNRNFTGPYYSSLCFNLTFKYPYGVGSSFYTLVLGSATFVTFDPATAFFTGSTDVQKNQTSQMNSIFQSRNTTFLFPFSHYYMFCSDPTQSNCGANSSVTISTTANVTLYPYQQLLNSFSTTIYFSGHVHVYEREYPTNLNGIITDTNQHEYYNPTAPIYIIEGAAGSLKMTNTNYTTQYFTAKYKLGTGYGVLQIFNNKTAFFDHYDPTTCSSSDHIGIYLTNVSQSPDNLYLLKIVLPICLFFGLIGISICIYLLYKRKVAAQINKAKQINHQDHLNEIVAVFNPQLSQNIINPETQKV